MKKMKKSKRLMVLFCNAPTLDLNKKRFQVKKIELPDMKTKFPE